MFRECRLREVLNCEIPLGSISSLFGRNINYILLQKHPIIDPILDGVLNPERFLIFTLNSGSTIPRHIPGAR